MAEQRKLVDRILAWIERVGNKLPDPALLFVYALGLTWIASWLLSGKSFMVPAIGGGEQEKVIANQLTGEALASFLTGMVKTFTGFHPLGVVLVALLGVGVAEESGFINAGLKRMLQFTPGFLLTPMLILVAIVSHTAADAGYVLVIPIGGVLFYAAGRHPLAGIAAAFAGVSGGFSANFVPSGIDPLLQGITQAAAGVTDASVEVNPLCNWFFTGASSLLIIGVGWFLTDKVIEPRLKDVAVDGDPEDMPTLDPLTPKEAKGLRYAMIAFFIGLTVLLVWALPGDSALRSKPSVKLKLASGATVEGAILRDGAALRDAAVALSLGADKSLPSGSVLMLETQEGLQAFDLGKAPRIDVREGLKTTDLTDAVVLKEQHRGGKTLIIPSSAIVSKDEVAGGLSALSAPLMNMIVPLIFLLFLIPGVVFGAVAGTFKSHRDVIKGMSKSMSTMGYYLVMAFFAALFIDAFGRSNIGALVAVNGADAIKAADLPSGVTIVGIIILCGFVNLLVGSASAKWALLAPIFVPMLMQLGLSPEFTQAAYRVGDSTTNIITPLMPYFPLVVAFSQRYVKNTGIGTMISMMLPYSIVFLVTWSIFLLAYWGLGLPLGIGASYTYGG